VSGERLPSKLQLAGCEIAARFCDEQAAMARRSWVARITGRTSGVSAGMAGPDPAVLNLRWRSASGLFDGPFHHLIGSRLPCATFLAKRRPLPLRRAGRWVCASALRIIGECFGHRGRGGAAWCQKTSKIVLGSVLGTDEPTNARSSAGRDHRAGGFFMFC
jgi:hypothetical protein